LNQSRYFIYRPRRWKVLGIVRLMNCYRPSPADVSSDVNRLQFNSIGHDFLCEGCLVLNK